MKYAVLASVLAVGVLLSGCQEKTEEPVIDEASPLTVENQAETLVTVNGSPITQPELDLAITRTLGETAFVIPGDVSGKMLESLVASRAMALQQERVLPESQRQALELQVQAYREELLVRQYVEANAQPQPVTPEMVRSYYQKNPEEFGGKLSRSFEVISTIREVDAEERKVLVSSLAQLGSDDNWGLKAAELKAKNLPVRYRKVSLQVDLLNQPLRSLVETTQPGQVSALSAGGDVMRVKVIDEQRAPARPLQEVSADIRRKLAPIQFRKSVKALSQQALKSAEVVYSQKETPVNPQGS